MTFSPLLQEGTAAPPTRRPRAFGRTSNVWQYVESVQERLMPAAKLRSAASPGDQLRRTSLDFAEDDDEGEGDHRWRDDDNPPGHRQRLASHTNGGHLGRSAGVTAGEPPHELLPKRKVSRALAHNDRYKRSSKAGMRSVGSLPELYAPLSTSGGDFGRSAIGSTVTAGFGSTKRALHTDAGAASTSALSPSSKRGGATAAFNSSEIIRRIQALGTSASVPYMHLIPSLTGTTTTSAAVAGYSAFGATVASSSSVDVKSALLAAQTLQQPPVVSAGAASTPPAAVSGVAGAALSDADKLRNDFNSQQSKLYYGCSVAFELFNGHLMMVGSPDGQVRVQSLEKLQIPQIKGCRDRAIFTIIDLTDVHSANTICYGDAVWLQLSIGTGDVSWEQGGVLGAQVREAPQLKALALSNNDAIRNSVQAPAIIGHPVPVKAYLPKSREDGDTQADEIQSRVRNKGSRMLGKWIIRSAVMGPRKHKDNFVYNNDEIYLEQDWFYLGADSDAGIAVLRQLPPSSSLKDIKDGEYLIERRAAWRIRLLDSTNGGSGLSLAQQQMERLLFRAKMQLKQSKKMRAGQTKTYAPDLHAGAGFTSQLRSKIAVSTRECDERHLERQERRLDHLADHLAGKAEAMNRRALLEFTNGDFAFPSDFGLQDADASAAQTSSPSLSSLAALKASVSAATGTTSSVDRESSSSTRSLEAERSPSGGNASSETRVEPQHVCALCKSSTIGYNLCSQIHSVMHAIESEGELETARWPNSQRSDLTSSSGSSGGGGVVSGSHAKSTKTSHTSVGGVDTIITTPSDDSAGGSSSSGGKAPTPVLQSSRRKSRFPVALAPQTPQTPQQLQQLAERDRILALFSLQDAHILDIIKFKERTTREALIAKEHARMGLSPVASHFRDRFKHVGLLAQAHMAATELQHGIGGHFQKLHAELFHSARAKPGGRKPFSHVEQLAQQLGHETFTFDMRTCPLEYPGEGFDVFGDPIDVEAPDPAPRTRLFPSERELELLAPVDTKAVMDTYSQNHAAVCEMLDGYVELCETHMVPNLHNAMTTYNRASLVEMLEFTARASEFVCARRVQVRVAQLMHAVADSDVGDFGAFDAPFDALMQEFDGTLAFIRFYRERGTTKKKRK